MVVVEVEVVVLGSEFLVAIGEFDMRLQVWGRWADCSRDALTDSEGNMEKKKKEGYSKTGLEMTIFLNTSEHNPLFQRLETKKDQGQYQCVAGGFSMSKFAFNIIGKRGWQ